MKLTAGYDLPLAAQFFRRSFTDIIVGGGVPGVHFLPIEVDWMSERLGQTTTINLDRKFGGVWFKGDAKSLAAATRTYNRNRVMLQAAEIAAVSLMAYKGLIQQGGLIPQKDDTHQICSALFLNASKWPYHTEQTKFVLARLSLHTVPWLKLLSLVPRNDLIEMIWNRPSSILVLPGDE